MLNIQNTADNYLLNKVAESLVRDFPEFAEAAQVTNETGRDLLDLTLDAPSWNAYPLWVLVHGHTAIIGFDYASRSVSFLTNDESCDKLVEQLNTLSKRIINEELVCVTGFSNGKPIVANLRVPADNNFNDHNDWMTSVDQIRVRSWNGTHDNDRIIEY